MPALAAALDAAPEPTADLIFGEGTGFRVGPERTTHLALYPAHRAVELTTPDVVVSFRRDCIARAFEGGVLFEARSRRTNLALIVAADGVASLTSTPVPATPPSPGLAAELARFGVGLPETDGPLGPDYPDDTRPTGGGGEGAWGNATRI